MTGTKPTYDLLGEAHKPDEWCVECHGNPDDDEADERQGEGRLDFTKTHGEYGHWLDNGLGACDVCAVTYDVGSQTDHCAVEGLCWTHCTNASHVADAGNG